MPSIGHAERHDCTERATMGQRQLSRTQARPMVGSGDGFHIGYPRLWGFRYHVTSHNEKQAFLKMADVVATTPGSPQVGDGKSLAVRPCNIDRPRRPRQALVSGIATLGSWLESRLRWNLPYQRCLRCLFFVFDGIHLFCLPKLVPWLLTWSTGSTV